MPLSEASWVNGSSRLSHFTWEYSQRGGFKESSAGRHEQERAWLVKQKERVIPCGDVTFYFNITYCTSVYIYALSPFYSTCAFFSPSVSFTVSFISVPCCLRFPARRVLCRPFGRHFAKPWEIIVFFLHAVALLKLITDSPLVALLMRDKMRPRQRENEREAVRANKILIVQTAFRLFSSKRVARFCETIRFQQKVHFH